MRELTSALCDLLDTALISLPAWHVIESLARNPGESLAWLLWDTGLDIIEAHTAIAALAERGLVTDGVRLSLASAHSPALLALCRRVECDREFRRHIIRLAARRECEGPREGWRVTWAPRFSEPAWMPLGFRSGATDPIQ